MKSKEEENARNLDVNGGKRVREKKAGPALHIAHDKRHVTLSQVTNLPGTQFLYMESEGPLWL